MKSIRITVQLPKDVPSNATSKVFFIFRGLEGDATPLRVGSKLALPSISTELSFSHFLDFLFIFVSSSSTPLTSFLKQVSFLSFSPFSCCG